MIINDLRKIAGDFPQTSKMFSLASFDLKRRRFGSKILNLSRDKVENPLELQVVSNPGGISTEIDDGPHDSLILLEGVEDSVGKMRLRSL